MIDVPLTEYSHHPETFRFFKRALNSAGNLMNVSEMMELADDLHQQIRDRRDISKN